MKKKEKETLPEKEQLEESQEKDETKEEEKETEAQTMVALTFDEYDTLQNEMAELQSEIEKLKDGWQRERADFTNYKKRVRKDAVRSQQDALITVLKAFLSVSDDLERALKNKPEDGSVKDWVNGINLIQQKLLNQLKNQGVVRMAVEPGDDFDPNVHEAITQEEHDEFKDGQIIEVVQPGYRIEERVIRPAMVRVAR